MKKVAGILFSLTIAFLFTSCSTTKETVKEETPQKDSVYVFDQAPVENKIEPLTTKEPLITGTYYVIQVGAFSTKEKAETYSQLFKSKVNDETSITFNNEKNLYLVQLVNKFTNKQDAEKKRDLIKENKEFSDVWIVTINK